MILKNAVIHDGLGRAFTGDLRIEDGLIAEVAAHIEGEGTDLAGAHVLPGFIDTLSKWGINGTAYEIRPSSDDNDEKSDPVTPEMDVVYAFNGRAITAQQLPAFGITACGVTPSDSNVFGGQAAAFTTDGVNGYRMCLKRGVALKASVAKDVKRVYGARSVLPTTRMGIFEIFRSNLRKAAEYDPEKEGQEKNDKLAAIRAAIDGEMPLFIAADDANDRQLVMDIVRPYEKMKVVFTMTSLLAESDLELDPERVSFIDQFACSDGDPRSMHKRFDILTKLMDKGMRVAVCAKMGHSYSREWMLWEGMELTKHIADTEKVLSLLTSEPAKMLGIGDVTGSIEAGKRADLVIWSMDPLTDFRAKVLTTMIAGKTVYKEGDEMKCYC